MGKITVKVMDYRPENEQFEVRLENGEKGIIPKEEMSIYPFKTENEILNLLGQEIHAVITEKNDTTIRLSRRMVQEERLNEILSFQEDAMFLAKIISASFQAFFMDLGEGIKGIIYKSEILATPFGKPTDVYPIGAEILVKIRKYNKDAKNFALSHKWCFEKNYNDYYKGQQIVGTLRLPIVQDGNVTGYLVEVTPAIRGVLDLLPGLTLKNGQRLPMLVHEVNAEKGLKLRLIFPN